MANNIFDEALRGESWWDVGGDNVITYCLSADYGLGWDPASTAVIDAAVAAYAAVCNLTFEKVADEAAADLIEYRVTPGQFAAAFPSSPYGPYQPAWAGYHYSPHEGAPARGYYDYQQMSLYLAAHEIGHGLGLEHPHTSIHGTGLFPGVSEGVGSDPGDNGLNNLTTTIMSYRAVGGAAAIGPMAFDIAALQGMYGANMATGAGNDVYALSTGAWRCIWDAGGMDSILGTRGHDVLDLRAATLLNELGGGGFLNYRASGGAIGGMTIAAGVVIENTAGGDGNDKITGNFANNWLFGDAGDDWIWGGSGGDFLSGGSGHDWIYGGGGSDVIIGDAGRDHIYVGNDADRDVVVAGNLDTIYQFDNREDKIDLSRFDIERLEIYRSGGRWVISADYDVDPAPDVTIYVLGQKPLASDILT